LQLHPFATGEQLAPATPHHSAQASQSWPARQKLLARFDTLTVTGTYVCLFGKFFRSQFLPRSQCGDVFAEPFAMSTGFRFARGHGQMLAKTLTAKHQAFHRGRFCGNQKDNK
jgi:hypothetical protein